MGLDVLNKKIHFSDNEKRTSEELLNISNLIIPFSIIFKKNFPPDIYSGEEIIPFEERNPKFRQILIYEFLSD